MYARGAEDNKGQLMYVLKAIETLIDNNSLKCPVKILLEGQEECGSTDTIAAVKQLGDKLSADILMVCDTGTVASGTPTILMGLRGMVHLTATLKGPKRDLHSGVHGGRAPNPAAAMARLISTLHDPDGTIAIEHYSDGIIEPSSEERERAKQSAATENVYIEQTGVPPVGGDISVSHAERTGFLPSLDINGIHSGYGGAGTKTIIPAEATAKISSRIVSGQDPEQCLSLIKSHLETNKPDGLTLEFSDAGAPGGALRLPLDSAPAAAASEILRELGGEEPAMLWEGASIPVLGVLAEVSGADPLLVGFASEADNAHAVDESFSLEQFRKGFIYAAMFLGSQ
jgi:acetylornithine deacetylase/succinyl-diaminopimelate desuccinylase-like protein